MRFLFVLPLLFFLNVGHTQNLPDSVWRNSWMKSQKSLEVALVNYRNHAVLPIYKEMQDRLLAAQTDKDNEYITANNSIWADARKVKADMESLYVLIKAARKDLIAQRKANKNGPFNIKGHGDIVAAMKKVSGYSKAWGVKESSKFEAATNALASTGSDYITMYTALQEYYGIVTRTERALANHCRNKMGKR